MGTNPLTSMIRFLYEKARSGIPLPGFCCLIPLVVAAPLIAQPVPLVNNVTIVGNTAYSANEISSGMATSPGQPFFSSRLEEDLAGLKDRYAREGYLLATFRPIVEVNEDSSSAGITIQVHEGKQFVIDSVYWSGMTALLWEDLTHALGLAQGSPFSSGAMERGIQEVLRLCEGRGYPLATVEVTNLLFLEMEDNQDVKIFLTVREGSQARIEEVRIEGNATTNDDVILRELRLDGNELYTDALAEAVQRRLERLQLFSSVSRPEFYVTETGSGGLRIRVREGTVNRFDGILGYVPAAGQAGGGYVTGFADIQLRNLFGTGRRLSTRWARENPTTEDLSLRYLEPWVASLPANAELGFAQRKQDSTYVRRRYDLSVTVELTEALTLGLSVDQASVFPSDRPGNPVGRSRIINVGGMVRYDGRDDPVTPQSGVLYATSYEWGSKTVTIAGQESGDQTGRLSFDLEYYVSPLRRQVLAAAFHGRDFQSTLVDQSDLYRLGGATTLRGYRESQFLGSRVLWSALEYRLLVGRRSFVYGFLDAGYVSQPGRPSAGLIRSEITRFGYGAGLRIDSGIGLIGVNLAFGEGDTFSTAKLHFRLINEF